MKTDTIKPEIMLRIKDKPLLDKLQTCYDLSHSTSVNEFLNTLLRTVVFKEDFEDKILDRLDEIQDKTNATYLLVKNGRN